MNPGKVPQLAAAVGLPLSGVSSGHISLDLPEGKVLKADGVVDLQIDDLVVGDGKAKIQNTIALPQLHMGRFRFKAQIAAGRLKIDECTAQGRDLDLTLTGGLKLRRRIENSIADMDLDPKPRIQACRSCGGRGVREVLNVKGSSGMQIQKCAVCAGIGFVRRVRYR